MTSNCSEWGPLQPYNFKGFTHLENLVPMVLFLLIDLGVITFLYLIHLRNWKWTRVFESTPYFRSPSHLVSVMLLSAAGILSILQVAQAALNADWAAMTLLICIPASAFGIQFLHWTSYQKPSLKVFFWYSSVCASLLLCAVLTQAFQLTRQASIFTSAMYCPPNMPYPYCRDLVTSCLQFFLVSSFSLLFYIPSLVLVAIAIYRHKFIGKYTTLRNPQRAFLVIGLVSWCLLFGTSLALGPYFLLPVDYPCNTRRLAAVGVFTSGMFLLLTGPFFAVIPTLWSILRRSPAEDQFVIDHMWLMMLLLILGLGVGSTLIPFNLFEVNQLNASAATAASVFGAPILGCLFSQLLCAIFLRGWRETSQGETLPLLANTAQWGKEIMTVKTSSGYCDMNFLIQDRDVVKIPKQDVKILNVLGSGGFGVVHLGNWQKKTETMHVAIKTLHFTTATPPESLNDFMIEIKFLSRLEHPNILRFLGVVVLEEDATVWMLTEYMAGGNLKDFMKPAVSLATKVRLLIDVTEGMKYLHAHQPPITHRDLKLENVLISSDGVAKIADFGLTVVQDHTMTQTVFGSLHIIAPEVFRKQKYTEKIDVYSFAILSAELISCISFHHTLRTTAEWDFMMIEQIVAGQRPILPEALPESLRNLLTESWHDDPIERPPFTEICQRLRRLYLTLDDTQKIGDEDCTESMSSSSSSSTISSTSSFNSNSINH